MFDVTYSAKIFSDRNSQVGFVYQYVMTTMNWFRGVDFGIVPKMFIATNFRGPLAGNKFTWRFLLRPAWFMRIHSSLQFSCKHLWPYVASRASVA